MSPPPSALAELSDRSGALGRPPPHRWPKVVAPQGKLGNLVGMRSQPAVHFFAVAFCLAMIGGSACSSSSKPAQDAGVDLPVEAGTDGTAPALDCQQIRVCMARGGTAADCAARGTAEAQAAFQTLLDCLTANCAEQSAACFCREACQQPDGYCLDQTDACVAASKTDVDAVCGQLCGG